MEEFEMAEDIEKLKIIINYTFNERSLLRQALTHRSKAVEAHLDYDNQRLEFLGDAVLEIILSEHLYRKFPRAQEGMLTQIRSAMVQQDTLAALARKMNLGAFILLGNGEIENDGANRDSTLADLFESVLGAVYLDGGLEAARQLVIGQPLALEEHPYPLHFLGQFATCIQFAVLMAHHQHRGGIVVCQIGCQQLTVVHALCLTYQHHTVLGHHGESLGVLYDLIGRHLAAIENVKVEVTLLLA